MPKKVSTKRAARKAARVTGARRKTGRKKAKAKTPAKKSTAKKARRYLAGELLKALGQRIDLKSEAFGRLRRYLQYFGDIQAGDGPAQWLAAIRRVQQMLNRADPSLRLPVDGIAGLDLVRILERIPRCRQRHDVPRAQQRRGGSWAAGRLKHHFRGTARGVTTAQQTEAFEMVFAEVARVCDLIIEPTSSRNAADLRTTFEPIDGPGGTLGIYDIPVTDNWTSPLQGEIDSREPWNVTTLYRTLLHELTHGLGRFHWQGQSRSIMEPFVWAYDGYTDSDAVVMVEKYDPPSTPPPQPPPSGGQASRLIVDGVEYDFSSCSIEVTR